MSAQSFRFLCAGGFHLHDVLQGLPSVPDHLLEAFISAPYRAAEQTIQTAIREEVDFVVLTGDLLDAASGGPRAVAFLIQQFEVLQERGIGVYWAASKLDLSSDWLEHIELPSNVHLFSDDMVEQKTIVVNERPAAAILGRSWNVQRPLRVSEFAPTGNEPMQLAVLHGSCDLEGLPPRVAFWAMGGPDSSNTTLVGKQVVHSPGWPQGFLPSHVGAHGCTLVHVDAAGDIRTRRIETDAVRWAKERIPVPIGATIQDIRNVLRLRAQKLQAEAGRLVAVDWTLGGDGWFDSLLVHQQRRDELLEWIREQFDQGSQPVWTIALELESPDRLRDDWTDEDTILGDFLRVAREFLDDEQKPLVLDPPAFDKQLPAIILAALPISTSSVRSGVLRESAMLGVNLLRGDERASEALALSGRDD